MESFQFIEYQKQRDFSKKINATFEFIKQNFKSLSTSILVIAGPPVLIGSLLMGSFISEFLGISQMATTDPEGYTAYFTRSEFWLQLLLMFVFVMISGILTIATINNYILLYREKRSNVIEVSDVWARVRDTFWMYFVTMFFFAILAIIAYVVLIIPIAILGAISPFLIFFGVIFFIIAFFWMVVSASLVFIVRANEKKDFFTALARSFKLVKGKWWSTFGLIMILYAIMMVISYIPMIPMYAMMITKSLHSVQEGTFEEPSAVWGVWTTVFFALYYMIQMLLNTLPNVGIAFQYFNLVELKEARGLMNEIQNIGQPQAAERPEEHF